MKWNYNPHTPPARVEHRWTTSEDNWFYIPVLFDPWSPDGWSAVEGDLYIWNPPWEDQKAWTSGEGDTPVWVNPRLENTLVENTLHQARYKGVPAWLHSARQMQFGAWAFLVIQETILSFDVGRQLNLAV